jgi:hypothetical protein
MSNLDERKGDKLMQKELVFAGERGNAYIDFGQSMRIDFAPDMYFIHNNLTRDFYLFNGVANRVCIIQGISGATNSLYNQRVTTLEKTFKLDNDTVSLIDIDYPALKKTLHLNIWCSPNVYSSIIWEYR